MVSLKKIKPSDQLGHNFGKSNSCTSRAILKQLPEMSFKMFEFSIAFLLFSRVFFTYLELRTSIVFDLLSTTGPESFNFRRKSV